MEKKTEEFLDIFTALNVLFFDEPTENSLMKQPSIA